MMRTLALIHGDPGEILAFANNAISKETEQNRFVTLLLSDGVLVLLCHKLTDVGN